MNEQPPLQAQGNVDFEGLTDLLKRLIDTAWGDWGTFCEAFPNGREPDNVQMPVITYLLDRMEPGIIGNKGTREIKSRYRYSYTKEVHGNEPQHVDVKGRVLDCTVAFEIWEENNAKATALATKFMDFMDMYTGFIKEQGVKEIIFQSYENSTKSGKWRDALVCRTITYFVRLEHLHEEYSDVIKKVTATVIPKNDLSDDSINETIHFEIPNDNLKNN